MRRLSLGSIWGWCEPCLFVQNIANGFFFCFANENSGPGQFLGSYVVNWMLATRLVQWLEGILHQRKKERNQVLGETCCGFRSFKTVSSSTNSGSYCLSWECGTYTFNKFSIVLWDSKSEGHWFGGSEIDTVKSWIQLLKIVRYRGHLHKEQFKEIVWYSNERIFLNIWDIVPKSAQNTHLTRGPIFKQCAVYDSRPLFAS